MSREDNALFMEDTIKNTLGAERVETMVSYFQKLLPKGKDDILILVTRKGFWIYQELMHASGIPKSKQKQEAVFSDRYLLKMIDEETFRGKRVYLMDDSVNHGYRIFRLFCILKKRKAKEIHPTVFAMSTFYPPENADAVLLDIFRGINPELSGQEMIKEFADTRLEFYQAMRCDHYATPEEVSSFSVSETELFQKVLCPLVIDLPMMVSKRENGSILEDPFVMTEEEFSALRDTDNESNWKYVRNVFADDEAARNGYGVSGMTKIPIQCNYFEYTDELTQRLTASTLVNMVIKCKYNVDKNGEYHLVFTPFAIVRSWEKESLKETVQILLGDTEYGQKLSQALDARNCEDTVWTAALRAVIYVLSMYVGEKFRKFLFRKTGREAGYDWTILCRNSEQGFVKAMRGFEIQEPGKSEKAFEKLKLFSETLPAIQPARNSRETGSVYLNHAYYETILPLVRGEGAEQQASPKIIDIETMEVTLKKKYSIEGYGLRTTVTKIILLMLETSTCGNAVRVGTDRVSRGFQRGENSQLLISPAGRIVFSCAEVLYITIGRKNYKTCFETFFDEIREKAKEMGLTNQENNNDFEQNITWFRDLSDEELHVQIMGKRFLLKNLPEQEKNLRDYAIELANRMTGNGTE